MKKRQKIDRSKATVPAILREPIVIESTDGRLIREELAQQVGRRLAAACEHFGVDVNDVDLNGATGTLVLSMMQHCFPKAFHFASKAEAQSARTRKHFWIAPRKRVLIALVEQYQAKGHNSVVKAVAAIKKEYEAARSETNYLRQSSVGSLATRYYEFKTWAAENPTEELGVPLNPDGTINFHVAASQLFSLYEKRHG